MLTNLLSTARLATLPAIASTPLCAVLLPLAASILLSHAVHQLLNDD